MSIFEIIRDEANQRKAKSRKRKFNLIFPYDPILDGVELDRIFKLDQPLINLNKNECLFKPVDENEF